MTVLSRGPRPRRSGRRPGWVLLTMLLVLAILASSALVFTNRVELLKLAVILALWAAVVAAFVSVIYRRQSDIDAAKARDLKLVYDLQLDREISARREYELTVESELRRELASEIRAQAADEVAALRAELAALRANLEYIFDTDLSDRPAIETEHGLARPGRVTSSRLDTDDSPTDRTEENPIIDVSAEPHAPEHEWTSSSLFGGSHRRTSDTEPSADDRLAWTAEQRAADHRAAEERAAAEQRAAAEARATEQRAAAERRAAEQRAAEERAAEERRLAEQRAAQDRAIAEQREAAQRAAQEEAARPAWTPTAAQNGSLGEYVGRRRAPEPETPPPRGRHYAPADAGDPGHPDASTPETFATPPTPEPPAAPPAPEPDAAASTSNAPRHRGADDPDSGGGYSVAELLARFEVGSRGGGRRRRRED
ncbi:DUF6779 domain-containing protein [Mycobacterium sp. 1274761.0]|uniref:DUF6779 domain-containing protein n=1 Tax=Mycobacterium sp. 1274761.0 TaxID=1834077 RepID=UPI000B1F0298|nr:DUF6779 domain-containing protein [Mycobacterium sp. 1274761.0]